MTGSARGRLLIYLGSAPGVGKTTEMLRRAQQLQDDGHDVVVGLVETHGRTGTAAALEGLEQVPRRELTYRGTVMGEMDLPAVLARDPEIALVDELAHTNVPGAEHVKRWQDIAALLDAGIDVHSTLNIQHLESLNDVVSRITGTEQQETVPDAVVRAADEIELIDVSPEQLRSRLSAGQVYRAEQVDPALGNYFRVGNLTALRELALLWLADRVDEALSRYRHAEQITDTWEARERVVVAVTGGPESTMLVRRASRIASRSSADLVVVHVLRGDGLATSRNHLPQVREVAASCGASVHVVAGDDVRTTLVEFARGVNATQLVLGTSRRSRWRRLFDEGIGSSVLQQSGPIDVHMVTHAESSDARPLPVPRPAARRVLAWVGAVAVPASILGVTQLVDQRWDVTAHGWFFLVGVLAVSLLGGVWPASVCALISALALNFFLTPPVGSLTVADPNNMVSLLAMVAVAIAVSLLVDLSARRHREASRSARDAELLTLFARSALRTHRLDDLLEKVRNVYTQDGAALVDAGGAVLASAGAGAPIRAEDATTAVTTAAGDHLLLAGPELTGHDREILDVVAGHASSLVRHGELARIAAGAQAMAETDRLRRSLLSAVGHDLRTPLAAVKLSVSSLRATDVDFGPEDTAELLVTIDESVDHLVSLVDNLLDSSRLAAGAVHPVPREVDVEETAVTALLAATVGRASDRERVTVDTAGATVWADEGLVERALGNLLDNALRHAPESQIRLTARTVRVEGHARTLIAVADRGQGIPEGSRETVLRAFHREGDSNASSGIGLGLSVVRGFVEAMGGTVSIDETPGGGTTVEVDLPACEATLAESAVR
ncbi:sensor histidine kinase [Dietzia alimentaria]|uniref:sensor histidine kinase n=1 Tax=Dietzia alimentaria TaxID=665550 RepID=UPI00029B00C9|nr:sensor histidine kinase KdpD [Dietzia alimentaria]